MSDNKVVFRLVHSQAAEEAVIALLKGGFVAQKAVIHYNLQIGLPFVEEEDFYPLTLFGVVNKWFPISVKVYSVTAGYGGTGPNCLVKILKEAGFEFDPNDILTKQYVQKDGWIHLEYTK